jgi:hypothetical protein
MRHPLMMALPALAAAPLLVSLSAVGPLGGPPEGGHDVPGPPEGGHYGLPEGGHGALSEAEQRGGREVRPAPRRPDGRVNLGAPAGDTGVWERRNEHLVVNPDSYQANATRSARVHIDDVPLQPWARALTNYRQSLSLASEPYTRCKASGGPRQFMSPYGVEIVDRPELERIYIFNVANAMSFRIVYTDGRRHPENLPPSYFGHSVGRWEGDTLVVDTVGFNERFWMNRDALPHTSQLHLTERLTRVDFDTLTYEVTVDDPGAYTAPWTSGYTLGWSAGAEMFEYVCQQNNLSPASMIGDGLVTATVP